MSRPGRFFFSFYCFISTAQLFLRHAYREYDGIWSSILKYFANQVDSLPYLFLPLPSTTPEIVAKGYKVFTDTIHYILSSLPRFLLLFLFFPDFLFSQLSSACIENIYILIVFLSSLF